MSNRRDFDKAVRKVKTLPISPDDETLLRLYALFKQVEAGDVEGKMPFAKGMVAVAKYKARKKCIGISEDDAITAYVGLVEECFARQLEQDGQEKQKKSDPVVDDSVVILDAAGRIDDWSKKTVLVSGASRGIGKAVALRFASAGANLILLGRTLLPEQVSGNKSGSLSETKLEVEELGAKALCVATDVRDEAAVATAVAAGITEFGGIDAVVCNAGALFIAPFEDTPMKRFDLVHQVNVRATFSLCQAALPALKASERGRILVLAPPISLEPKWFDGTLAYTISKYGMSMLVIGLAAEMNESGVAVNAMWPATTIDTAAVRLNKALGGDEMARRSRKPTICADAAFEILSRPSEHSGQFHTDESALREIGVKDFSSYAVEAGQPLQKDFYL